MTRAVLTFESMTWVTDNRSVNVLTAIAMKVA